MEANLMEEMIRESSSSAETPYYTQETIYNHQRIYVGKGDQSSPSFLKDSIENTPIIKKMSSEAISDFRIGSNIHCLSQIVSNLQDRISESNEKIKSEIKRMAQPKKEGREKLGKTIKLKEILEHGVEDEHFNQNACFLIHRNQTLEEEEQRNFQVDEDLNFIQLGTQEEGKKKRNSAEKEKYQSIGNHQVSEQSIKAEEDFPKQNKFAQNHPDDFVPIQPHIISTINGVLESKDFWEFSEENSMKTLSVIPDEPTHSRTKRKGKVLGVRKDWSNQKNLSSSKTERKNENQKATKKEQNKRLLDYTIIQLQKQLQTSSHKKDQSNHLLKTLKEKTLTQKNSENSPLAFSSFPSSLNASRSESKKQPKGVYEIILSGYSTAKLLAINRQYKEQEGQKNSQCGHHRNSRSRR